MIQFSIFLTYSKRHSDDDDDDEHETSKTPMNQGLGRRTHSQTAIETAQILRTHPNAQEAWLPIWNSNLSG